MMSSKVWPSPLLLCLLCVLLTLSTDSFVIPSSPLHRHKLQTALALEASQTIVPAANTVPSSLLQVILHSSLNRKASSPTLYSLPSSSPSYAFLLNGSSRPQIRALVSSIKTDVKQWSLHQTSPSDNPPLPVPQFPENLTKIIDKSLLSQSDISQWSRLLSLSDGLQPLGLGFGQTTRNQGDVYQSGWIVLDYGDVVVHVMTDKSRNFYNLDGKYEDEGGEVVDLVEAGWVDAEAIREEEEEVVDSDDPFWS
ncbi:hypothetical protein TrVE_jg3085 [Triparma verrucosa]|uniref:Uncharacterized protein n=1 Tax=Triparma verrucosa TaxID=1606542 RepID=A0A9W7B8T7_9STRA|nr:hypothetical protein TrVE_jg3085 [Triparma verrucosa]